MGTGRIKKALGKLARVFIELTLMSLTAISFLVVISVVWLN